MQFLTRTDWRAWQSNWLDACAIRSDWRPRRSASVLLRSSRCSGKMIIVRFVQQQTDIVGRLCLFKELAKRLVSQLPRNVLERAKVISGTIGRRDEDEKQLDLLSVEAVEIDPFLAHAHGSHEAIDARMLGVRDGHAAANSDASQFLALPDRLDDSLDFTRPNLACF